jgi:hypothetical protein
VSGNSQELYPDLSNIENCMLDAKNSILDTDPGPKYPLDYNELRGRLEVYKNKLPKVYREAFYRPFIHKMDAINEIEYAQILENYSPIAGILKDITYTIIQNGENYNQIATNSFHEVVSDLYDGFLSMESQTGIKTTDRCIAAPLIKWGAPDEGPYTYSVETFTKLFDMKTTLVNLPPANSRGGIFFWALIPHEVAGHDILSADPDILPEIEDDVRDELKKGNFNEILIDYWASRLSETASDVLGILNMGPAPGIAFIGTMRGYAVANNKKPLIRCQGPRFDPHPADVLRGYLAASTVRRLKFDGAQAWGDAIQRETDADSKDREIRIEVINIQGNDFEKGISISHEDAIASAKIVADTIAGSKLDAIENHRLEDIQNWHNKDEWIVSLLKSDLLGDGLMEKLGGYYAAHVVAAAVTAALSKNANIDHIFKRMLDMLKLMHDVNPSVGPLYCERPSDAYAKRVFFLK